MNTTTRKIEGTRGEFEILRRALFAFENLLDNPTLSIKLAPHEHVNLRSVRNKLAAAMIFSDDELKEKRS